VRTGRVALLFLLGAACSPDLDLSCRIENEVCGAGARCTRDLRCVTAPAPLSPPTLVFANAEDQGATVGWAPVVGAVGYFIYLASETGVTSANYQELPDGQQVNASVTTTCSGPGPSGDRTCFRIEGLTNGKTYFFVVTTFNGELEGGWSTEVSAVPGT